jgi:hypothetical protein
VLPVICAPVCKVKLLLLVFHVPTQIGTTVSPFQHAVHIVKLPFKMFHSLAMLDITASLPQCAAHPKKLHL